VNPIGGKTQEALKLQLDVPLRLEFQWVRGARFVEFLACRELDMALGLMEAAPKEGHK